MRVSYSGKTTKTKVLATGEANLQTGAAMGVSYVARANVAEARGAHADQLPENRRRDPLWLEGKRGVDPPGVRELTRSSSATDGTHIMRAQSEPHLHPATPLAVPALTLMSRHVPALVLALAMALPTLAAVSDVPFWVLPWIPGNIPAPPLWQALTSSPLPIYNASRGPSLPLMSSPPSPPSTPSPRLTSPSPGLPSALSVPPLYPSRCGHTLVGANDPKAASCGCSRMIGGIYLSHSNLGYVASRVVTDRGRGGTVLLPTAYN